jgi:hypothetical protein
MGAFPEDVVGNSSLEDVRREGIAEIYRFVTCP